MWNQCIRGVGLGSSLGVGEVYYECSFGVIFWCRPECSGSVARSHLGECIMHYTLLFYTLAPFNKSCFPLNVVRVFDNNDRPT